MGDGSPRGGRVVFPSCEMESLLAFLKQIPITTENSLLVSPTKENAFLLRRRNLVQYLVSISSKCFSNAFSLT